MNQQREGTVGEPSVHRNDLIREDDDRFDEPPQVFGVELDDVVNNGVDESVKFVAGVVDKGHGDRAGIWVPFCGRTFIAPAAPLVLPPEEIAKAPVFLASEDSSFVVGSELATDGGMLINGL